MSLQLPLFQEIAKWRAPVHLPNIPTGCSVAIDTENHDPDLLDRGPAFLRGLGRVAGVSLCWKEGQDYKSLYLPFGHFIKDGQLDKGVVVHWLKRQLNDPARTLIFYNAQYDLGWLRTLGIFPLYHRVVDVQVLASLVHEEHRFRGLDGLAKHYLGTGKDESALRTYAGDSGVDAKADMWMLPCSAVGAYAEEDAVLTYRLYERLLPTIIKEGSQRCLDLECEVTPVLLEMMLKGIRVDLPYAEELNKRWLADEQALLSSLRASESDIWEADWCVRHFQSFGIEPPKTEKGNYSIKKGWVESLNDPRLLPYMKVRAINRTRKIFLEETILRDSIGGRIFPQYVQMASDEGGTRTGRLSCKNPNAQQFPKRSKLFDAKSIRKCFLPEEGELWSKKDYWSQEPVIQLHYGILAKCSGTDKVREAFEAGKKLYTFIEEATNGKCDYDQSKGVLLGRSYGMGKQKMADTVHLPLEESLAVLEAFDNVAPYIKDCSERASQRAAATGFLRTLEDRPIHFHYWEHDVRRDDNSEYVAPMYREEAEAKYGKYKIRRADVRKAYNKLIQGGAASQTKRAMVEQYRATGLVPLNQVHDDIGHSVADERTHQRLVDIQTNCLRLRAPVRVDAELLKHWM